ncbi:P-loop containing nucleoside triphosphate hydrolase protein [Gloeophyllum trabeum ATCC 11539]|uniref:p-loop containing nucleoside triphosphate hydrolase protein n=1 Tax=Gloeophyllum trabeum (strain ATCC 11539 / FP-39264 / Madison 617) TaxID=670483 RepID=S7Q995_GLOTA|nr:P-loop containing nucleoside triphosphate hydrolase protein [Gloeophyllum trabeum ATCC 11539]EPQ55978.1 P-loop containing nucleoside triphosphate hydrolase protein [Gloeophyllum trabeum ATCC 11539]
MAMNHGYSPGAVGIPGAGFGGLVPQFIGFSSLFAALFSPRRSDALKLVATGALVESGRRLCQWLWERLSFRYCVSVRFFKGDPTYEWITSAMASRQLWRKSSTFRARAKTAMKMVAHAIADGPVLDGHADLVPVYDVPYLFCWKGYVCEFTKSRDSSMNAHAMLNADLTGVPESRYIDLKIFTRDIHTLSRFVEEAHDAFVQSREQRVLIRSADGGVRHPYQRQLWTTVKTKARRPLDSLILEPGVIDSIIADMQEFMKMENWYVDAGIPHRRGYLLYGPPGTGKTSTIHAIAGELDLDIYTISLASNNVDDTYLQHLVSQVPARSMLLIEDIDCAFPSRDEDTEESPATTTLQPGLVMTPRMRRQMGMHGTSASLVTLSGLLNVIDGIGSEDGRMFFATTNHIDRLDAAFLRPGRVDVKVEYKMASIGQARALFSRFFPVSRFGHLFEAKEAEKPQDPAACLAAFADQFAETLPEHEFSTAEIQGYLLGYKSNPAAAVAGVGKWAQEVKEERAAKKRKEEEKEEKRKQAKLQPHREAGRVMASEMGKVFQQSLGHAGGPPTGVPLSAPHGGERRVHGDRPIQVQEEKSAEERLASEVPKLNGSGPVSGPDVPTPSVETVPVAPAGPTSQASQ